MLVAILVPTSSFASTSKPLGAGEWDTILASNYTLYSSSKQSRTVNSGGGDAQICVTGVNAGNSVSLALYSDDPIYDDHILTFIHNYGGPSGEDTRVCSGAINVEPYQDGTYAELYLVMRSMNDYSDSVHVEIED